MVLKTRWVNKEFEYLTVNKEYPTEEGIHVSEQAERMTENPKKSETSQSRREGHPTVGEVEQG